MDLSVSVGEVEAEVGRGGHRCPNFRGRESRLRKSLDPLINRYYSVTLAKIVDFRPHPQVSW